MNAIVSGSDDVARHHTTLALRVRYLAVPQPYVDPNAPAAETLGQVKAQVLTHFGLVEGDANGGRKEYALAVGGVIQSDLSATIGTVAAGKQTLELNLLEQFVQG
jgi:hypothetical protein